MREQDKSTPPQFPPVTPSERAAQLVLSYIIVALEAAKRGLAVVLAIIPEMSDDELNAIGEREVPDSVAYCIRGNAECAMNDDIEPAIKRLQEASEATPESLYREWLALPESER